MPAGLVVGGLTAAGAAAAFFERLARLGLFLALRAVFFFGLFLAALRAVFFLGLFLAAFLRAAFFLAIALRLLP